MKLTDCIRVVEDALPAALCSALIEDAQRDSKPQRFDADWRRCTAYTLDELTTSGVRDRLRPLVQDYRRISSVLNFATELEQPRVLRYRVSDHPEGFHQHADAWNVPTSTRQVGIIAYLNDVDDGGETAFQFGLARHHYVPRRGRVLMFPANFLFMHEAYPPRSADKFALVTWLHFGGAPLAFETSRL